MKKILTVVLDGFGYRTEEKGNAILQAKMNNFISFFEEYPHTLLNASEEHVGLLKGQMGNSEVGHQAIGAGKVIKSSMLKINDFFDNDFESNENFKKLLNNNEKRVHIIGLCSDGNVHASINHFIKMHDILCKKGFKNIYFHIITDGRDTKVNVCQKYIKLIQKNIHKYQVGAISSVCGRYYAMDRDENYDRTKAYYDLVTKGIGLSSLNIDKTINLCYEKNITDEFIPPIILNYKGLIKDGDAVCIMNYRADRIKQILKSLTFDQFDQFETKKYSNLDVFTFFCVDKKINTINFLENDKNEMPLGIYLSKLGLKQARIAESEKFPHVTYFFDGGYDGKIEGCDKFHISSPNVPTYDQMPEMSAYSVCKKTIEALNKDYDFILVNFANPDMVGHTGSLEAARKACMVIDECLSKIFEAAKENFYNIVLLADHGNCEYMINSDGSPCTTHTLAKVPFIIDDKKISFKEDGNLTNVAPTILDYMNISIPEEMTSESILIEEEK